MNINKICYKCLVDVGPTTLYIYVMIVQDVP